MVFFDCFRVKVIPVVVVMDAGHCRDRIKVTPPSPPSFHSASSVVTRRRILSSICEKPTMLGEWRPSVVSLPFSLPSISPSPSLSVPLSASLSQSLYASVVCLSVALYLSMSLSVCLSVCLSVSLGRRSISPRIRHSAATIFSCMAFLDGLTSDRTAHLTALLPTACRRPLHGLTDPSPFLSSPYLILPSIPFFPFMSFPSLFLATISFLLPTLFFLLPILPSFFLF